MTAAINCVLTPIAKTRRIRSSTFNYVVAIQRLSEVLPPRQDMVASPAHWFVGAAGNHPGLYRRLGDLLGALSTFLSRLAFGSDDFKCKSLLVCDFGFSFLSKGAEDNARWPNNDDLHGPGSRVAVAIAARDRGAAG